MTVTELKEYLGKIHPTLMDKPVMIDTGDSVESISADMMEARVNIDMVGLPTSDYIFCINLDR